MAGSAMAAAAGAVDGVTAYSINRLTIICAFSSMNYKWRIATATPVDAMRM